MFFSCHFLEYSHLSNNRGGWNKRGGWHFLEKLVHKCNKRGGVEGGKNLRNNLTWRREFFLWRVEFFKIGKRAFTCIREMRILRLGGVKSLVSRYIEDYSFWSI